MTPRCPSIAALAIVAVAPLSAQTAAKDPARAAELRARGIEAGYNLDYDEAATSFAAAIAADPDDPASYRLAAATTWIRALFEQGTITVADYLGQARATAARPSVSRDLDASFHESIRRAVELSEAQLARAPSDADAHYQAGAAYSCVASYTATVDGRLAGSFGAARRAYREHGRVLELDPRRQDAGLIVGLYNYTVASLSAPVRLLAHLAGFGGDRARALAQVERAASYPGDAQPNALFTLILIYNREDRPDAALRVIDDLRARFPRNRLLWLEAADTALRAGRPVDARRAVERGLDMLAGDPRPRAFGEDARWRFTHGSALAALGDPAAESELRTALKLSGRTWLGGRIHHQLAEVADRGGRRDEALAEARLAERLCRQDHDDDGAEQARRLLARLSRAK
ncbi:MAG TPA: tetratricopeptide repeat protein [Vicinamibacterales bacterium]|nr:tetratricopeptide repeat protein [Vicinamibacterales bacterium]